MRRLAARDHLDGGEHVEAADGQLDEHEEHRSADAGQRHIQELLPCAAAVDLRGLVQVLRHLLQRRQKDDHVPADALPDAQNHRNRKTAPPRIQPTDVAGGHAQHLPQEVVQQALRVEDIAEDQGGNHPRGHNRQVVDDPEGDAEALDARKQNGDEEPKRHLSRHGYRRVHQAVDKDRPECRIPEDLAVVGQTGKGLLQHRGKAHVAQAHPEQADDRIDSEQCEDRQPRCQQKRDLRSLGTEFHVLTSEGAAEPSAPPPRKSSYLSSSSHWAASSSSASCAVFSPATIAVTAMVSSLSISLQAATVGRAFAV